MGGTGTHAASGGLWWSGIVAVVCLWIMTGCVSPASRPPASSPGPAWKVGHILDVKTGEVLSLPDWLARLSRYDIVYVGEEHYNRHHIEAAVTMLEVVRQQGVRPVLTMEMFGWDGQAALDEGLADGRLRDDTWLERVRWKANWGGAFEPYGTLVEYAARNHLPLYAMNPPKPLIRQVVTRGLRQVQQQPDWAAWGLDREEIVDDPRYRERILDQLRRCHGGGTDEDYRAMYEASMVRDEGMAKTVAHAVQSARKEQGASRAVILSYTGGGHIQYNLPVPSRVVRRLGSSVTHVSVYLASYEPSRAEDIRHLMEDGIADYVWLTAVGEQGTPQRCR